MANCCRNDNEEQPLRRAARAPTALLRMMTQASVVSEVELFGGCIEGESTAKSFPMDLVVYVVRVRK
jgi:hypothetical protein